jgi:LacI family transcriptional regulator
VSTVAKISQRTGLAFSTVAGVLRNAPGFSKRTRALVLRTADDVGYRPNFLSKALAGGKSMTIGVVGSGLMSSSSAQMLESVEAAARASGYLCFLANTDFNDPESQLFHLRGLLDRRVDGVILDGGTAPPPKEVIARLRKINLPHVFTDWAPASAMNSVTVNRVAGYKAVARYLAKLGHRNVACLITDHDLQHPQQRFASYRDALAARGIDVLAGQQWSVGGASRDDADVVHSVVTRQLKRHSGSKRPSAILLFDDLSGLSAIRAAADLGIRVPQDLSVIGFDDSAFAGRSIPALTTIRHPRREVGEAAFQMLHLAMTDPASSSPQVEFSCSLIVRESTGPAAEARSVS